jgi:hypothetical protein
MSPAPPPPPPAGRRAHARVDIRLSAEVRVGDRRHAAATKNLSLGGCCIESAYPLAEGAEVALALFVVVDDIELANLPALECRAAVQWTVENDDAGLETRHVAGLRFVELTADQAGWLQRFVTGAD